MYATAATGLLTIQPAFAIAMGDTEGDGPAFVDPGARRISVLHPLRFPGMGRRAGHNYACRSEAPGRCSMTFFKRGTRGWQLLTLAIIATPWFLRDHLATTLDAQRDAAVHVLTEFDNEVRRQDADYEQRQTRHRLIRIENLLEKQAGHADADKAEQDAYNESVREEGDALINSLQVFEKMLAEISIDAAKMQPLQAAAERARKAAEALKSYEEGEAGDALIKEFDEASEKYQEAFAMLRDHADAAVDATGRWADYARIAAWLLTALGALMLGDWSRVLGGRDADAGDKQA